MTHLDDLALAPLRKRYGTPRGVTFEAEVSRSELDLVIRSGSSGRRHDVTFFAFNGERLALIRKTHFAPGVWRPPSGGVHPGEDAEAGILREALEETGVAIRLERYLLSTDVRFTSEGRSIEWRTHVLTATTEAEELSPLDTEEIAAARWGTIEELAGPIRERALATGRGLWRYRTALHDAAIEELRQAE